MKISLIENGIDSLKKGFEHLKKYEEMHFIDRRGEERFFTLKEAILSINHGIEILFKQVLKNHNEFLIFSNVDKTLKSAYLTKNSQNLSSVFETEHSPHTVTMQEAISRLSSICGVEFDRKMLDKVHKIEKYRNQITHSEVFLEEEDIGDTFDGLIDGIDSFFLKHLNESYSSVSGYTELQKKYTQYLEKLGDTQKDIKREVIEKLIEAFSRCGISMGENEARIISDINVATKIIDILKSSNLKFGSDFYNGHNSGSIKEIKRMEDGVISMYASDNKLEYRFKFKAMMLYIPKIESNFSPIIFFEAAEYEAEEPLKEFVTTEISDKRVLSAIRFSGTEDLEYDSEKINKFLDGLYYGEIPYQPYETINLYLTEGIFCFINIQGLQYGRMADILRKKATLKEIQVLLNIRSEV